MLWKQAGEHICYFDLYYLHDLALLKTFLFFFFSCILFCGISLVVFVCSNISKNKLLEKKGGPQKWYVRVQETFFPLGLIKPGSHMWLMLNPSQLCRHAGSKVVTKISSCRVNISSTNIGGESNS